MTIKVGDKLPEGKFRVMGPEGPAWKTTDEVFKGKKVVLFAVPGAFTPTCSNSHLPGFLKNADAIKAKGIDAIAVTGVNDVFVMEAWKKSTGAGGKIRPQFHEAGLAMIKAQGGIFGSVAASKPLLNSLAALS